MSWLFYSCKIVYILALMIIVLGKIADILKKNRKKLEDKSIMVKSQLWLLSVMKMNPECHRSCIGKLLRGQGLRGSQGSINE